MKPRHKRALIIVGGLLAIGTAVALALNSLESNLTLYITPSEVAAGQYPKDKPFRIGGLVKVGSLHRDNLDAKFIITDTAQEIAVRYTGILPDLFKESKGAVIEGRLLAGENTFVASQVLAKHDENYMPPAAQEAIDKAQKP